ncbi:MAG: tetratricopeptide repeat protein [Promethearchaeota archaeon]|jgi:tetratricopeptide (TPR) repeat protein
MFDDVHRDLYRAIQLFLDGKEEESLQIINEVQEKIDLNQKDKHFLQFIKGYNLYFLGRFEKTVDISNQLYENSKKSNNPLFLIDAILFKFSIMYLQGRVGTLREDIVNCKNLLKSASQEPLPEFEMRRSFYYFMRGYNFFIESEYDKAIHYLNKSIAITEQYSEIPFRNSHVIDLLGSSYSEKGELDKALKFHKKSLKLIKGSSPIATMIKGGTLSSIGFLYYQQKKLDRAAECFEECLNIFESNSNSIMFLGNRVYLFLIPILLDKGAIEVAEKYLERFNQFNMKFRIPGNIRIYELSKARILKYRSRTRNRGEAEKILIELVEKHDNIIERGSRVLSGELTSVLIELCDLYLEELRTTQNLDVLNDITPYINKLLKEAEHTKSYSIQAHTFLLQGQLALLQMNMGDARRFLTNAQKIADDHDLQLLASAISREHDKLLEQLGDWETLKKQKASVSDRMNLVSLNNTIGRMQGKRAIELAESIDEDPMLLLILGEGGILLFSYPFTDEWKFDEELFGGFLTAFNSISDEIFSEGLDRVKFGKHTVLMEPVVNFSVCYLFKGESYIARQKLKNFANHLQRNNSIQETLDKFYQTCQILEIKDFPFLESLITEVFLNKSSEVVV